MGGFSLRKLLSCSYEEAIVRVPEALKTEGFGVLTEIDVKETLKKKLNVEFRKYRILGACNPPIAHQALQIEDRIGLLLPCNVIVQEYPDGKVEVATIDPVVSMERTESKALAPYAEQVRAK